MDDSFVQVEIKGLLPTPNGAGVFLEAEGKVIAVFIDAMVAQALRMAVEGTRAPRPLTHDLLRTVLEGLGVSVSKVVIHDLQGEVYFARIALQQENELGLSFLEVDARPSDSLVLALQAGAPVWIARKVLEESEDMRWAMEASEEDTGEGPEAS
jgi:bifunctional DNase/RNase